MSESITFVLEGYAPTDNLPSQFRQFDEFCLALGSELDLAWTHVFIDVGQSSASYIKFKGAFHKRVILDGFSKACSYYFSVCEVQDGFLVPIFSVGFSILSSLQRARMDLSYDNSRYSVSDPKLVDWINWAVTLSPLKYGWGSTSRRPGGDEMTLIGGDNGRLSKEERAKLNAWYRLSQEERGKIVRGVYPKMYMGPEQLEMISSAGISLEPKDYLGGHFRAVDICSGGKLLFLSDDAIALFSEKLEAAGLLLKI